MNNQPFLRIIDMKTKDIKQICEAVRKGLKMPLNFFFVEDYEGELEGTGRAVNFNDDYMPVIYEHNHERKTISGKKPCKAWAVDVVTVMHGGFWEQDDVDVSASISGVSFQKALTHALQLLLEWEINNALDAVATQKEAEAEIEYDKELAEMEPNNG